MRKTTAQRKNGEQRKFLRFLRVFCDFCVFPLLKKAGKCVHKILLLPFSIE